ncbi:unnamed protein product [Effrenium voratum]|uniref:Uncharacterized protein n=1 Tax=Effrenium voratum TaxID=2562239 RepID=A0AA36N9K4_9DINO|nr:unnamed protein product [Effrenium voratum]
MAQPRAFWRGGRGVRKAQLVSRHLSADFVDRNYEVVKPLNRGSFSRVNLVRDRLTGALRVCKVIDIKDMDPHVLGMMRKEVQILSALDHPNIVRLFEFAEDERKHELVLILEYVQGGDCIDLLEEKARLLPEQLAARIIHQLLVVLNYCHKCGITHRDVKPENVMLTSLSEDAFCKVIDFGLATPYKGRVKEFAGTVSYLAPELAIAQAPTSGGACWALEPKPSRFSMAADIWAVGVTAFELLAGAEAASNARPLPPASVMKSLLRRVEGRRGERQPGSRQALGTLSCINALNFADRYVPSAVKTNMQLDLGLNDWQSALPAMAMTAVFTVASLIFGFLADRELLDRRVLLAGGIAFWSFATALAGFAQNLWQLMLFRSLVGVGEAAFATVASPMIADFYPAPQRNRAYTIFGLSAPVGAAIGFGIGSIMGQELGWRCAFFVCGFPGVVVAFTVLLLNDPPMGINDDGEDPLHEDDDEDSDSDSDGTEKSVGGHCLREELQLLRNPYFLLATMGMVAITFAIGGLSEWYPTFLVRYAHMEESSSGLVLSGSSVLSGIGGTVLGSKVADYVAQNIGPGAFFLVPAAFMVPGAILIALAANLKSKAFLVACIIFGETFFFTYQAPITALSMSVLPVHSRGRGSSLQILLCHALGDVISPPIIGFISDKSSLQLGMQLPWMAVILAGLAWFCGYFCLAPPPMATKPRGKDTGTITNLMYRGVSPFGKLQEYGNSCEPILDQLCDYESFDEGPCLSPPCE